MTYTYTPYIIPYIIAAGFNIMIISLMWRRKQLPGAGNYILFVTACHIWLVANALEIMGQDIQTKLFWIGIEYPAITIVSVAWFLCITNFAGWHFSRKHTSILWIIPCITIFLNWTNSSHHLMRTSEWLDSSGPYLVFDKVYGPWFWVHAAYTYLLMFSVLAITVYVLFHFTHLYQNQAISWILAGFIPGTINIMYIFELNPFAPLDATPVAFTISGMFLLRIYQQFSLFDIIPTAREHVLQSMEDAVIVLDPLRRIADVNLAARTMLQLPNGELIGLQSEAVFARWPNLIEHYRDTYESHNELEIETARGSSFIDIQISPLYDKQQRTSGRVIVLRDVTESIQSRQELQHAKNTLEHQHGQLNQELQIAHSVQIALLPKRAPWSNAQLATACVIHPAQAVGGDFYTFVDHPERATIIIGDISGKGVAAALLMALVVNAVEDCARETNNPKHILQLLQERVGSRLQASGMLACVQIIQYSYHTQTLRITNAGMIAPILLRNNRAELLETYGLPIGTGLTNTQYSIVEQHLHPGDTIILTSDGLVEAQNPSKDLFGFEQLLEAIENSAHNEPQHIMDSLLHNVQQFQSSEPQHDDQTLVVFQIPPIED